MARYRNVSGHDLFIVAISKTVEDDGVFDVSDVQAPGFDCQPTNYERLDEPDAKPAKKEKSL